METEPSCDACGTAITVTDARAPRLCAPCAAKTGLAYPLPSRRGAWPCMRCGGAELIRAQVRERTVVDGTDHARGAPAPLAITYGQGEEFTPKFFSLEKQPSAAPNLAVPFGVLDAYVCRACGFVEWYAQEPEKIPIGATFGTSLVQVPGAGPFRGP